MTTAYGERINIQKKHHVYRKNNNNKNTRNGYKLMTVKKTTYKKKGPFFITRSHIAAYRHTHNFLGPIDFRLVVQWPRTCFFFSKFCTTYVFSLADGWKWWLVLLARHWWCTCKLDRGSDWSVYRLTYGLPTRPLADTYRIIFWICEFTADPNSDISFMRMLWWS